MDLHPGCGCGTTQWDCERPLPEMGCFHYVDNEDSHWEFIAENGKEGSTGIVTTSDDDSNIRQRCVRKTWTTAASHVLLDL